MDAEDLFNPGSPGRVDSGLNAAHRWGEASDTSSGPPLSLTRSNGSATSVTVWGGASSQPVAGTDEEPAADAGSWGEEDVSDIFRAMQSGEDWEKKEEARRDEIEWMKIYDPPREFQEHDWVSEVPSCLTLHYDLGAGGTRSVEVYPRLPRAPRQREDPQQARCHLSENRYVDIDWVLGERPTITSGFNDSGSSPLANYFSSGSNKTGIQPTTYELRKYKAAPKHTTSVHATIKCPGSQATQGELIPITRSIVGGLRDAYGTLQEELNRPKSRDMTQW